MENMFNDIDFMSHDEYIETIIDSTSTMGEDTNETSGVNEENDTASSMGKDPDATSSTGGEDNKASNEVETFESKNEEKREKNPSKKKNKSYWEAAETDLDDDNRKILVAEALGILCKVVMNNHVYSFNGKIMLQTGKGCIGDEAIGIIALIIMIWWSRKFKNKLKDLKIENDLLKIYIDDINGVYETIKTGAKFINGNIEYDDDDENDDDLPDDMRTMRMIGEIANSIEPMITVTTDVPSNHNDGKLPMLDVKVWIENNKEIFYQFYEKPTKNRYIISKDSAIPL